MRPLVLAFAGLFAAASVAAQDQKPAAEDGGEKKPRVEITVKGAKDEAAAKAKLRADSLLAQCKIKPVMTDEEILLCKNAYKQAR